MSHSSTIRVELEDNAPLEIQRVLHVTVAVAVVIAPMRGVMLGSALLCYVLFMHTIQRLTRVWRFPAFSVSDCGFLRGEEIETT